MATPTKLPTNDTASQKDIDHDHQIFGASCMFVLNTLMFLPFILLASCHFGRYWREFFKSTYNYTLLIPILGHASTITCFSLYVALENGFRSEGLFVGIFSTIFAVLLYAIGIMVCLGWEHRKEQRELWQRRQGQ